MLSNHIVSIVPAAAIGLVCGGLSIAFTVLNLKAARLRQRIVGVNQSNLLHLLLGRVVAIAVFTPSLPAIQHSLISHMTQTAIDKLLLGLQVDRQRRMLEPLIFTLIFITFSMLLPLLFSCQTPDCVNQQVLHAPLHCLVEHLFAQMRLGSIVVLLVTRAHLCRCCSITAAYMQQLLGQELRFMILPSQGIIEPICQNGTTPDISRRTAEKGLEHWTCGTVRGLGPIQPYNPLAVLMDVPGAMLCSMSCI